LQQTLKSENSRLIVLVDLLLEVLDDLEQQFYVSFFCRVEKSRYYFGVQEDQQLLLEVWEIVQRTHVVDA